MLFSHGNMLFSHLGKPSNTDANLMAFKSNTKIFDKNNYSGKPFKPFRTFMIEW